MAKSVVSALYDTYNAAERAVYELEAAGFIHRDIGIIASNAGNRHSPVDADGNHLSATTGAEAGAALGGVVGGGAGLLAGLGMLVIPGMGPVVAAGWLAAAAAGALAGAAAGGATGGILGAFIQAGLSKDLAHVYAEGVRRGGALVTVRVADSRVSEVERILQEFGAVDPKVRAASYRAGGWKGFDEHGPDYGDVKVGDRYRDPYGGRSSI